MLATAIRRIAVSYGLVFFVAVLADANFPTASVCSSGPEMVRADGETFVIYYLLTFLQQHSSFIMMFLLVPFRSHHHCPSPICIAQCLPSYCTHPSPTRPPHTIYILPIPSTVIPSLFLHACRTRYSCYTCSSAEADATGHLCPQTSESKREGANFYM